MNKITEELLSLVGWNELSDKGAYNIREDGLCASIKSTEHIKIVRKEDGSGLEIYISSECQNEDVYIPACVTASGIHDLVTNEFFISDGANVNIIAGCGVHSDEDGESLHNGIHRFFVGKNATVSYIEKHVGTGKSKTKNINTQSDFVIAEGAVVSLISEQLGGVNSALKDTKATLAKDAIFTVRERLLTNEDDKIDTNFDVVLSGENSKTDIVSRSVARGDSVQKYTSRIEGCTVCTGHSECDSILGENGYVEAAPCLVAKSADADLIHEAAIGKIAGEQILKLQTMGLTREEAEEKIIEGFLK